MGDPRPLDLVPAFEALSTLMDAASAIAGELRDDPLLARWMAVFSQIPPEDRRTVLAVLEREVAMRVASESGADGAMGFRVTHPNPNARIYSRVATREPTYTSVGEIGEAMRRIATLAHAVLRQSPGVHPRWEAIALEHGEQLPPEELEALAWYGRLILSIVERVRARRLQSGAA
ncbi:MAG: hypothetical protein KIT14_00495 [bacterium]|nr:hypothetical protein [bacterium]